jgi:RecA/RadA recombinase
MARHRITQKDRDQERLAALAAVAGKSKAFRPAREVLRRVRSVPTIFPSLDLATRVGGWPIDRAALVHGPSGTGKTLLCTGLGLSFLKRGHFFKMIDAERTTPITWVEELFHSYADHPGFSALRPSTYEAAVADVREWATTIGNAKAKGKLPDDCTGLAVVDSVRKLVPKAFYDKIVKAQADADGKQKGTRSNTKTTGVDGVGGRSAQMKAHYHALWLDELTALLDDTGTAIALITREHEDTEADYRDKLAGRDFKVSGGAALIYDSSMLVRVERSFVWGPGKEGEKRPVYGECHKVTIRKSKVAGMQDREEMAWFCTSNGVLDGVPPGFDAARDIVRLGKKLGVVQGDGWLHWQKNRWHGEDAAVRKLTSDPGLSADLEKAVRAAFPVPGGEVAK